MNGPHRTVLVAYERLDGWCERFGTRHGGYERHESAQGVRLSAPDGAVAEYDAEPPPRRFGLILVRRGGFAVGLVDEGEVVASKCGTRYVQGKTKAGGWSQQRYARRRSNQAEGLARAAADAIRRVLRDAGPTTAYGGGDRRLAESALSESGVTDIALSQRWLDVPEPRRAALDVASRQVRSVRIALNDRA